MEVVHKRHINFQFFAILNYSQSSLWWQKFAAPTTVTISPFRHSFKIYLNWADSKMIMRPLHVSLHDFINWYYQSFRFLTSPPNIQDRWNFQLFSDPGLCTWCCRENFRRISTVLGSDRWIPSVLYVLGVGSALLPWKSHDEPLENGEQLEGVRRMNILRFSCFCQNFSITKLYRFSKGFVLKLLIVHKSHLVLLMLSNWGYLCKFYWPVVFCNLVIC